MQGGLDGQILQPRILGHAVGLHPILSVFAILVGLVLFGLLGALFACPAAGIIQTFVQAGWRTWRTRHPDQFSVEKDQEQSPVGLTGHNEHCLQLSAFPGGLLGHGHRVARRWRGVLPQQDASGMTTRRP